MPTFQPIGHCRKYYLAWKYYFPHHQNCLSIISYIIKTTTTYFFSYWDNIQGWGGNRCQVCQVGCVTCQVVRLSDLWREFFPPIPPELSFKISYIINKYFFILRQHTRLGGNRCQLCQVVWHVRLSDVSGCVTCQVFRLSGLWRDFLFHTTRIVFQLYPTSSSKQQQHISFQIETTYTVGGGIGVRCVRLCDMSGCQISGVFVSYHQNCLSKYPTSSTNIFSYCLHTKVYPKTTTGISEGGILLWCVIFNDV